MAKAPGKDMYLEAATNDISTYTNDSSFTRRATFQDTTGYGADDEDSEGTVRGGDFTAQGVYDTTATVTPRAVFKGAVGTKVAMVRGPEGNATGKPKESFNLALEEYTESAPVMDMIKWSIKGKVAGGITDDVFA